MVGLPLNIVGIDERGNKRIVSVKEETCFVLTFKTIYNARPHINQHESK